MSYNKFCVMKAALHFQEDQDSEELQRQGQPQYLRDKGVFIGIV